MWPGKMVPQKRVTKKRGHQKRVPTNRVTKKRAPKNSVTKKMWPGKMGPLKRVTKTSGHRKRVPKNVFLGNHFPGFLKTLFSACKIPQNVIQRIARVPSSVLGHAGVA